MDDFIANTTNTKCNGTCMLFTNLELQILIGINRLTPMSDQGGISLYNINTTWRKLMRVKYKLWGF